MKSFVYNILKILILFITVPFISSCHEVVIVVDELPSNTPAGEPVYIAGNFNFWDPGNTEYQLKLNKDSVYVINLPRVFGNIEYKFTRGDWTTVEKNKCGYELPNRLGESKRLDTIRSKIASWSDLEPVNCDSVTIVVTDIPLNTPIEEEIKVIGNFNAWNPADDSSFVLKREPNTNDLAVTIPVGPERKPADIEYKLVRGIELKSEADEFGKIIDKRMLNLSKEGKVYVKIDNWEDSEQLRLNTVTIILTEIPKNTPSGSSIYLTGNFNDWNPGDERYKFKTDSSGNYSITIPRREYGLSFKITRGRWETEAANRYGEWLSNSDYNYNEIDTIYFKIHNWRDIALKPINYLTLILTEIPENTPNASTIYIAGNFNNWNPRDPNYKFRINEQGQYVKTISSHNRWVSYKITRGGWATEAADIWGDKLSNTYYRFSETGKDTFDIEIEKWLDLQ